METVLGQTDHSVVGACVGRELGGMEYRLLQGVRLDSQRLSKSKKLVLDTPSSGADAKVKRCVKQELALSLVVSLQDCQKAPITAYWR